MLNKKDWAEKKKTIPYFNVDNSNHNNMGSITDKENI